MSRQATRILFASVGLVAVAAYENGLARTPQMGWNTWNTFACNVDQDLLLTTATALVDSGLRDLGYEYLVLDDCWSSGRDPNSGRLIADTKKFPSGMKALADKVHEKGLKFGMYSSAGVFTCGLYEGSLGHEEVDAKTFAEWGVDYLKYDNCYNNGQTGTPQLSFDRYAKMSKALNATGRPIFYSLCNWGEDGPWNWGATIANSWRTTGDIHDNFDEYDERCPCEGKEGIDCKLPGFHCSAINILDKLPPFAHKGGPGNWNDLDMLAVGMGEMTYDEYVTHFSMWSAVKSSLILGNDIRTMTASTRSIITNKAILAISQDALGAPALRRWKKNIPSTSSSSPHQTTTTTSVTGNLQLWSGPLANNSYVVAIMNLTPEQRVVEVDFNSVFGDERRKAAYRWEVRDLWGYERLDMVGGIVNSTSIKLTSPIKDYTLFTQKAIQSNNKTRINEILGTPVGEFTQKLDVTVKSHGVRVFRFLNPGKSTGGHEL